MNNATIGVLFAINAETVCNLQVDSTCWRATLHVIHPAQEYNNDVFSEVSTVDNVSVLTTGLTRSSATVEIARSLRCSRSFKVNHVGTDRKPVCDFILVNNTKLHPILHRFPVIATYAKCFS